MFAGRSFRLAFAAGNTRLTRALFITTLCVLTLADASGRAGAQESVRITEKRAHELAEKFSRPSDSGRSATKAKTAQVKAVAPAKTAASTAEANAPEEDELRAAAEQKAYEEDMLERARAEAEARVKADSEHEEGAARARAEAASRTERERQTRDALAAAEKARKDAETQRTAEAEAAKRVAAERMSDEKRAGERETEARTLTERLRAARLARKEDRARGAADSADDAIDEAKIRADEKAAIEEAAQEEARAKAALERGQTNAKAGDKAKMRADEKAAIEEAAREELRAKAALERAQSRLKQRSAGLAERIEARKRARLALPRVVPPAKDYADRDVVTGTTHQAIGDFGPGKSRRQAPSAANGKATILLVMTPGNRGIRRWNKSADPIVCVDDSCYISSGSTSPARRLARGRTFGPGVALGERAGACNNQTACVFRSVDVVSDRAWMQPIDLRILRHDRRESRGIAIDPTCTMRRGRLACQRVVESVDYRAWIIPEGLAQQAGPDALAAALADNLNPSIMAFGPGR